MLLLEEFNERTLSHMDRALECVSEMMPEVMEAYAARRYVAGRIIHCAKHETREIDGLVAAGRRAVAELAVRVVESD
jgi:hypothetical protein